MRSYPFTSQVTYDDEGLPLYDRAIDSAFLRNVFAKYFSDGIFYKPTNALQVVADTGMKVAVEPGCCHIQGAIGIEDSRRTLVVQASESLDRIDTVVARLDLSLAVRDIDLYVVKGTAAVSPQPPALTRDATVWELGLANLFVAKNTQTISQQRITDTRLDASRCGVVAQTIGELDTSPYFAQIQAALADIQQQAAAQLVRLEFDFDSWLDTLKGKLGDDPATALQAQVDDLQAAAGGMPLELSAGSNSVQITADENRLESVKVAGFTTQTGTGDPSPTNIRLIENAGADGTTFVDVNGQQTQIPLQAPLHEGDTLETNVVYNGAFKCVETHVKATVSVDGQTTLFTQDTNGYAVALPGAADGAVICNAFSGLSASSQSVTIPASAFPSTVTNLETANTWAQSQNVVIEYPLSIPKVYADTSVPIDNPQGASILSSEEGTMLTVYIRSTKELQPLTVSLNGASQGQYNGETKQDINLVVTPQSIGALPKIKYTRYKFPDKQVLAQNVTLFEATQAAMGIPDNGRVVSILVESTGWTGLVPQHWSLNLGVKTVYVLLYNATQAAHTVGPVILLFYYEE